MFDDDDLKFSIDDIKDMVSEYFGEKVEKVDAETAKELLRESTKESLAQEPEQTSEAINDEVRELLEEFELFEKEDVSEEPEPDISEEIREISRQAAESAQVKIEEANALKTADEEARRLKREENLRKIEEAKKESVKYAQELQKPKHENLDFKERLLLINMFEQAQKMLAILLSRIIKRKPVETMYVRTLQKAIKNNPEVLKRADINQHGKERQDGTIEVARVASNVNWIGAAEIVKNEKLYTALREIFEERLIAVEVATELATKEEVLSNLLEQTERAFTAGKYGATLNRIFFEKIIPDTTLKQGE